jgi:hypothetical protein
METPIEKIMGPHLRSSSSSNSLELFRCNRREPRGYEGFLSHGGPPKLIVYNGKSLGEKRMIWGYLHILGSGDTVERCCGDIINHGEILWEYRTNEPTTGRNDTLVFEENQQCVGILNHKK